MSLPHVSCFLHSFDILFCYSSILVGWTLKATLAPRPFLIYCASPSDFWSFLICPLELSGSYQQRRLVAKHDKLGEYITAEFCLRSISFILVGFFNMPECVSTALRPLRRKWRAIILIKCAVCGQPVYFPGTQKLGGSECNKAVSLCWNVVLIQITASGSAVLTFTSSRPARCYLCGLWRTETVSDEAWGASS
jgi:hypothetical protein